MKIAILADYTLATVVRVVWLLLLVLIAWGIWMLLH